MAKLARASGARIVTNIDELAETDLGYSRLVEERKVENDKWVFIEQCKNPKAVSILVRGGSQRVVDEAETTTSVSVPELLVRGISTLVFSPNAKNILSCR